MNSVQEDGRNESGPRTDLQPRIRNPPMIWKQIRQLCLAGLVGAAFVGSAQAHFLRSKCCQSANDCGAPAACAPAAPVAAAPATRAVTVNCIEYVQEQRQVTCTVYKMEQR